MSCEKEEVTVPTELVTFKLNVAEFSSSQHGMKSAELEYTDFEHKYKGADITFISSEGKEWQFTTTTDLESFSISLPVGTYTVSGESTIPSRYGEKDASYTISNQDIIITTGVEKVNITITSTCALILVKDEKDLLSTSRIYYGQAYPLCIENSFKYTYVRPYGTIELQLYKKTGESFKMETNKMEIGYIYYIVVTDEIISGVTLTNDFKSI